MAKQTINQGTAPTGAGGDTFRSGSAKLQANDDELYAQLGANASGVLPAALPVNKGGTGATATEAARTNLGLGTAATANLTTSATDSTAGRVMKVGDFGLGATTTQSITKEQFNNPTQAPPSGFYCYRDSTEVNTKYKFSHVLVSRYGSGYGKPMMIGVQAWYAKPEIYFKTMSTDSPGTQYEYSGFIYHTSNTTVDSNGFIKAASPIVKLFSDKIELNDEAEQQDISFEKLGVGDYLIKGSSGFAQEGWYVETPKDANGNVLFSVIYETLENGDISVKTYKKKFDIETASIVADLENPVDITENRWIDLRLQELPQPEIEMPGSIAPPDFQPTGIAQAVSEMMNGTEQ